MSLMGYGHTMKLVINSCYGGPRLSATAAADLGIETTADVSLRDRDRADPRLVEVVERHGAAASTPLSDLRVVVVPDGKHWLIDEYDGYESVYCSDSAIEDVDGEKLCGCCVDG